MRTTWEVRVDGVLHHITVLFDAEYAATFMTRKAMNRIGKMPRCSRPLMITHIDEREEQVDHHYQLVVKGKDGKDVWVNA